MLKSAKEIEGRVLVGCICERLGNIMFQIATHISYSERTNRKLYLAINEANPEKLKEYDSYAQLLDRFNFVNLIDLHTEHEDVNLCVENPTHDYTPIPDYDNDIVSLVGYFQDERYFNTELVRDFYKPLDGFVNAIHQCYGDLSEATSLSVRRGDDYVNQPEYFNTPSGKWYENAYNKYFKGTKAIITSDDIEWAKKNVKIKNAIFVEDNQKDSVFWDLYVCSLCKNHIIYPGTYGWMGAWLGEKEGSQVVCPDKWWGPKNAHITEQIVPDRWIRFKL